MRTLVRHPQWGIFIGCTGDNLWWTGKPLRIACSEVVTFTDDLTAIEFFLERIPRPDIEALQLFRAPCDKIHVGLAHLHKWGFIHDCKALLFFKAPEGFA